MTIRKRKNSGLILGLLLALWVTPGCGTECGNPICIGPGASSEANSSPTSGQSSASPSVATPFDVFDGSESALNNALDYTDGADRFAFRYMEGWLLETPSANKLTITSPGSLNASSFVLEVVDNAMNLETALEFAEMEFPDTEWTDFKTASTTGVFFKEPEETLVGSQVFQVVILKNSNVFIIDIVRNAANDGVDGINLIMNTFE